MRRVSRRCALLLALAAALSACHSSRAQPESPYLCLADQDDVPTLDPARGYDTASWQFEEMLFSTLVDYDDGSNLIPELALTWEVSPNRLEYTFHLRHDARFSNGRGVVAGDVRYAIERVLTPKTRSQGAEFYRSIRGADACTDDLCAVEGIETPDAYTIRFRLRAFDPLFLHKLAMPFAAAVPREVVAQWGEDFGRHPVGSGAFRLVRWASGQELLFEPNPDYFVRGRPRLAGVQRLVGVNDELAWLKYESGQLDVANIPAAEFPEVIREPRYAPLLHTITTMRTNYLGMNCRIAPFTDRHVRQAMNYGVDKDKLLRLLNRRGVVAKGVLPPNLPGYNPALRGYEHDAARARALLAEAGYTHGFTVTLWARNDELTLRMAESIQQDLADVGVHIEIKPVAWGPFLEAVRNPDLVPLFSLGWEADFPDPSDFLEVLLHSKNIGSNNNTNYSNPEVDRLLDIAAQTVDTAARFALLRQVEAIVVEDAPWVFLYHPTAYEVVSPRVRDFRLHPLRPARFDRVWLAAPAAATP